MYYRVAIQVNPSSPWQWRSTILSSLDTLFQWLRLYRALPQDHLRVFSSSSCEEIGEQFVRENKGFGSSSVTATQFLHEKRISSQEGAGGASVHRTRGNQARASIAVATNPSLNKSSTGAHAPDERGMSSLERRRVEVELGVGGDHNLPYTFVLPRSLPQALAWTRLLAKVHTGALQP
jgi:hypothetical protein